jgi:ABC-type multidrug transport system fused ATPase/permease subunit
MIKEIFSLLVGYNYKKIYFLILSISTLSILEMISIGSLLPIISSLTTENTSEIFLYQASQNYFGITNIQEYVIFISITIGLIFIIKFIFSATVVIYSNNVLIDIKQFLSEKLIIRYTNQSYTWHSNNNKTYFLNLITNELSGFALNTLSAAIYFIIDIFILIAVITVLFFINLKLFIYIFLLTVLTIFFINKFSKKFSYSYGVERTKMSNIMMKHLNESLSGIKEIILYSSGKFISKTFLDNSLKLSKSTSRHLNSMEIIRYLIELIGVFLVLAILIKIFFDPNIAKVKIIETLGIYIIALFKLLPILNRLSTYSQRIRNGLVSAEKIKTFLNTTEQKIKQKNNIDFNSIIELKNISYKYPSQKKLTLDNINFEIKKNQIVGIIGKSGEGKTTLTNILMGLLSPLSGNIFIDGKNMIENNLSISNKTSFLSQIFFSIDANIPDNIVLSDKKINFSNLRYAIRNSMLKSDIANKKLRLKMHMGDSVKNLSGGQLQKINIARAMYRKPQLLIMDEPTSALDIESQKKLANNLLKLKKQMTIIIISHNYEFLVNFDKIYELKNNKLELIKNIA